MTREEAIDQVATLFPYLTYEEKMEWCRNIIKLYGPTYLDWFGVLTEISKIVRQRENEKIENAGKIR